MVALFQTSHFRPLTQIFFDHRLSARLDYTWITLWVTSGLVVMASNDSDVSKSLPSRSATPLTSTGSSTSTSHRSCPRCARRMSSLKFDKHFTCVKCRDKQCFVEIRCSGCESWSVDFMLGYVKHQRSLVSKGGEE